MIFVMCLLILKQFQIIYLTLSIWIKVTNNSYSLDKKKSLSYIHFNQENMSCLQKRCKSSNILYEIIIKDCIFDRTIFDGLLPFLTYSISSKSLCLDILHLNENCKLFFSKVERIWGRHLFLCQK